MPPRTGSRRRRRAKQGAPRHLTIIHTSTWLPDTVIAHSVELDGGHLVLRDQHGAVSRIVAAGEWREIRPTVMADIPWPEDADKDRIDSNPGSPEGQREEATLAPPPDCLTPPNPAAYSGTDNRPAEETDGAAREQAVLANRDPFVPSSPEEAQRILMEIERRLGSPEATRGEDAPPAPPRKD